MKKNFHKRSVANLSPGGMHVDQGADASNMLDSCPVFMLGKSKGSCRKFSYDPAQNTKHIIAVTKAARLQRQAKQATSSAAICTWPFELADIATKLAVKPPKRSEMDEASAAAKNKSIKELGLYWRRASY